MLNIVICGTPGTGKSRLVESLKSDLPKFNFVNLSQFAIQNDCVDGFDESLATFIMDEDKLIKKLKPVLKREKLNIIESIHGDLLPADLVDWVYVCRSDNTLLYDRLKARNYNEEKISNNLQAEIFQTIYDEAVENFDKSILTQLISNEESDLDRNAGLVRENIKKLLNDSHEI